MNGVQNQNVTHLTAHMRAIKNACTTKYDQRFGCHRLPGESEPRPKIVVRAVQGRVGRAERIKRSLDDVSRVASGVGKDSKIVVSQSHVQGQTGSRTQIFLDEK